MIPLNNRLHLLVPQLESKPNKFLLHFLESLHLHFQQNSLAYDLSPFQGYLLQLITEDNLLEKCFACLADLPQSSVGQLYLPKQDNIEIIQFFPDFIQHRRLAHDHLPHFQETDVDHSIIPIGKWIEHLQWFHYPKQVALLPHLDDLRDVMNGLQKGILSLLDTIELHLRPLLISVRLYLGSIGALSHHMLALGLDPFDLRIALFSNNRSSIMIPVLTLQLQC